MESFVLWFNWETSYSSCRPHRFVRVSYRTLRMWSTCLHLRPRKVVYARSFPFSSRSLPVRRWYDQRWWRFDLRECFLRPSSSTLRVILLDRSFDHDFDRTSATRNVLKVRSGRVKVNLHWIGTSIYSHVCCIPWSMLWLCLDGIWPGERWIAWNWSCYSRRNLPWSHQSNVHPTDWCSPRREVIVSGEEQSDLTSGMHIRSSRVKNPQSRLSNVLNRL